MKSLVGVVCFLLSNYMAHAQYKVQFILKEQTAIRHDSIFVTGNFSDWDSTANPNYLLRQNSDGTKSLTLKLKGGVVKYKFHRGSWLKVEKQDFGDEVPDRSIVIHKDTTLVDSVLRWRDQMFIDKWYALAKEKEDSNRVKILASIAYGYGFFTEYFNSDSALFYAQTALQLQQKTMASSDNNLSNHPQNAAQFISLQEVVAFLMHSFGNYPKALELRLENLKLAEKGDDKFLLVSVILQATNDYVSMKDFQHVLSYSKLAESILNTLNPNDPRFALRKWNTYANISTAFYNLQLPDSALKYSKELMNVQGLPYAEGYLGSANKSLADVYAAKGDNETALMHYRLATVKVADFWKASAYEGMAKVFKKQGRLDSALVYGTAALYFYQTATKNVQSWGENSNYFIAEISPLIADLYKASGQLDSAYKYLQLSVTVKDSLYNTDKVRQFQTIIFNDAALRKQQEQLSKEAQEQYETKIKLYGLASIITGFIVLAVVLYRNNKHKQQANTLLQRQKQEIETTLLELKNTQKQLIQSEKMASLGELTAGIAHEIQNPLNFVNNFSELNRELIGELKSEKSKLKSEELDELLDDIAANEEKINHHGKRADAIVKGMLEHSRTTKGEKQLTNLNALTEEYLRLAYHGLRAKDNSFNTEIKTSFDESIGKVSIIPQDIGRVLLNLYNNAFYAVHEKKSKLNGSFEPLVSLYTKNANGKAEIIVTDNGNGIPQNIVDKIFQPFFTTKPTGQGTGLGLSLSYDIVKAHRGEIRVESKEGEGTQLIVTLPLI